MLNILCFKDFIIWFNLGATLVKIYLVVPTLNQRESLITLHLISRQILDPKALVLVVVQNARNYLFQFSFYFSKITACAEIEQHHISPCKINDKRMVMRIKDMIAQDEFA